MRKRRPVGILLFAAFFGLGALINAMAAFSLATSASALAPMWRLNPRAEQTFADMGHWSLVLLVAVSLACSTAAIGCWRGTRWGYWTACVLLIGNLVGDVLNVTIGTEPRAAVGVPIVLLMLWALSSKHIRAQFR
jgi:hypothetical protein